MSASTLDKTAAGPEALVPDFSDFDTVPLFMRELPSDANESENTALEALRTLVYEDSPEETAKRLKDQANDLFKAKQYRNALGFYTQAITELEDQITPNLRRTLYSNRAACQLSLENYGSCVRDCAQILKIDPTARDGLYKKALYRSASALFKLEKYDQALDAIQTLAQLKEPLDPAAVALLDAVQAKLKKQEAAELKKQEEAQQRIKAQQAVKSQLVDMHILPSASSRWTYENAAKLAPHPFLPPHFQDENDTEDQLLFPVFLCQPFQDPPTRDLIPEWHASISLEEQMTAFDAQMNNTAALSTSQFYIITRNKRILKLGHKLTLSQVAKMAYKQETQDGLELIGGWCLELYVLPQGQEAKTKQWIADTKASFAK